MKDTGIDMPYYATPLMEVVFHEAVRMPVVKGDPKQIMKVKKGLRRADLKLETSHR